MGDSLNFDGVCSKSRQRILSVVHCTAAAVFSVEYFDRAETASYRYLCDRLYYLLIIPLLHCSLQKSKLGAARNFFSFKHTGRKQLLGEACNAYDLMLGGAGNAELEAEYRERMLIPYILQHLHTCALMKWKFVNPLLILQGN